MSGIAGFFRFDGRAADAERLHRMTQTLAHRGGLASCWTDGCVGLGGQKRPGRPPAISSPEPRPFTAGPLTLVADARIDNRDDLLRTFGWQDSARDEVSDEALILRAYERWGADCPTHLVGAFAFALWDGRTRTLLCARDHFGIRPFYYHRSKDLFAFGSEIKALFALPHVPRRPCDARVAEYLMLATPGKEATFYEDVLRLPPAHVAIVTPSGVRLRRYWTLDPEYELHLDSTKAYVEAFRDAFDEAVRCRLRNATRVGSFLSGGLDSSSISVTARELLAERQAAPLDTFSMVFDEVAASDERPFIESVVAQGGVRPHYVRGDQVPVLDALDPMLRHVDEPFFAPNLYLHWASYDAARRQGVDAMLDGFLGDSVVFYGDYYLTELLLRGRWLAFGREAKRYLALSTDRWEVTKWLLSRYALDPLLLAPLRHLSPFSGQRAQVAARRQVLSTELVHTVRQRGRADLLREERRPRPRTAREAHHAELSSGIGPAALEVVDHAAAAFGIEPRFPFVDRRLVELSLALPPTQRFFNTQTRVILRRALAGRLPEEIRNRQTKGNLSHAFEHALRTLSGADLRTFIEERLPIAEPYLDVAAIRRALRNAPSEEAPQSGPVLLWQAVVLTRWLEREREASGGAKSSFSPLPFGRNAAISNVRPPYALAG